jgi:hypothetical protein
VNFRNTFHSRRRQIAMVMGGGAAILALGVPASAALADAEWAGTTPTAPQRDRARAADPTHQAQLQPGRLVEPVGEHHPGPPRREPEPAEHHAR